MHDTRYRINKISQIMHHESCIMNLTLDTIRDIKLYQNKKGYRFSVDALLLYSFVNLQSAYRIADLGSRLRDCRNPAGKKYHDSEVALIEIQNSLAGLAEKNITLNKVEKRVRVIRTDIKKFKLGDFHSENKTTLNSPLLTPNSFDLVVSNPPFRRQKTGVISPTTMKKLIARHEIELKLADLIQASCSLLRSKGRFCMIYHPSRLVELIDALRKNDMEPKRFKVCSFQSHDRGKDGARRGDKATEEQR